MSQTLYDVVSHLPWDWILLGFGCGAIFATLLHLAIGWMCQP